MEEKAAGRDGDAIVVVDPHADLVEPVCSGTFPLRSLTGSVRLIDLADRAGSARASICWTPASSPTGTAPPTRWCACAKGLWDQWGPRMQSILEFRPSRPSTRPTSTPTPPTTSSYTILDGFNHPGRRQELQGGRVLAEGERPLPDPSGGEGTSSNWTGRVPGPTRWPRCRPASPTTRRPSGQGPSWASPAPPSTCERRVIREGGILLVSTAQGVGGP